MSLNFTETLKEVKVLFILKIVFMHIDEETGLDIHVAFTAKHINLANSYTG
jgi:hypothetical protein